MLDTDLSLVDHEGPTSPSAHLSRKSRVDVTSLEGVKTRAMRGSIATINLLTLSSSFGSVCAYHAGAGGFLGGKVGDHNSRCRENAASSSVVFLRPVPNAVMLTMKSQSDPSKSVLNIGRVAAALMASASLVFGSDAAIADGATKKFSLPPISQAKDRCTFKSSAMGQANAARDSLYDLRECTLRCAGHISLVLCIYI